MAGHGSGFDQWVDASDNGRFQASSGSLGLGELPVPSSASSMGVLGTLESSLLPQHADGGRQLLEQTPTTSLPDSMNPPHGWPGFVHATSMPFGTQSEGNDKLMGSLPSRGGLFDNEKFIGQLAATDSTRPPNSAGGLTMSRPLTTTQSPWKGFTYPIHLDSSPPRDELPGLTRPETPALAYVDRASMPGFVDYEDREHNLKQLDRDKEVREASSWTVKHDDTARIVWHREEVHQAEDWEADLLAFKRYYGCDDVEPAGHIQGEVTQVSDVPGTSDVQTAPQSQRPTAPPDRATAPESGRQTLERSLVPTDSESMLNTNVDSSELIQGATQGSSTARELPVAMESSSTGVIAPRDSNPSCSDTTMLPPRPGNGSQDAELRKEAEALDQARDFARDREEQESMLAAAQQQGQELKSAIARLQGGAESTQVVPAPPLTPKTPNAPPPPGRSRLDRYTAQDYDVATDKALTRVKPDGNWRSEYTEAQLHKRDFFIDLRKQREKDKGRQATGPIWSHLSTQAKNLSNTLDLAELLEALKLFASVRCADYELYMRLLGEVPNHITLATAAQLCELVRILSRRRLRERNYVDMVAAHLLQKIRVTDDALPTRQLIKAANAFAALECRSRSQFVEHFLRHIEHRVQEFDASLCCLVSPVFIDQYMNDSLRRAFLVRCAETHAGFQCELQEARNIACMELVLRKEHHSLVTSLPSYVVKYLQKVQRHAEFDKWGAVTLPSTAAPDGPKGNERVAMSKSLELKASTATSGSGRQADVFSSDMHRDVSACLTHLGVEHENGVLAGPYLLDIVALDMVTPNKRLVFEVNDEHHYYVGTRQLIAEQRLRHRMIARLGHKLHMVNAEDWRKLTAAQKMTFMLKLQQGQQDANAKEEKLKAQANAMRAPLPALPVGQTTSTDPMRLKSISDLSKPIRVPVPPSQRSRLPLSAR